MKYVTENGVKLSQFFYLFFLILPWMLLFIVPVSLFVAILVVYNRLIYSNEITILKNSGLTKMAICRPIVKLTIACTLFCYLVSFYLMPYANKQLRLSRTDLKNNYSVISINPQTFETFNNLTIYAKERDKNNNLFGIILHDEKKDKKKKSKSSVTITARKGNIVTESNSALLYMEDGTIQKLDYETNKSEILNFDNYVFNLTETQKNSDKNRWKARERYLHELLNPDPEEEPDFNDLEKYRTEIHQRLTYPLLSIIFSILALAFILRGSFSRHGNILNIVFAASTSVTFLILVMISYSLIESTPQMTPFLYLLFILFFLIGIKMLTENNQQKS